MAVEIANVPGRSRSLRRVAVITSASGNGGTTFAREVAARLGVPFHELDALNHGPGWVEAGPEELRAKVVPIVARDAWVIDGPQQARGSRHRWRRPRGLARPPGARLAPATPPSLAAPHRPARAALERESRDASRRLPRAQCARSMGPASLPPPATGVSPAPRGAPPRPPVVHPGGRALPKSSVRSPRGRLRLGLACSR